MKVDRIMALALALPHKHAIQDQTEALIEAGYAALQADDIKLAEALFRQAVQTNVRSAEAWRALAETQYGARYAICLRWAEEAQAAARRVISAPYAPAPASRAAWLSAAGRMSAISASALLLLVLGSDLVYLNRVLPGVYIDAVPVGNLTLPQVEAKLAAHQVRAAQHTVELRVEGRSWRVPARMFLQHQGNALAKAAFVYGHEPSFWNRTTTRVGALFGQDEFVSGTQIDATIVQQIVAGIANTIDSPRHDAQLVPTPQGWIIVPEQNGRHLDQRHAVAELTTLLANNNWNKDTLSQSLQLRMISEPPRRTAAQLIPIRDQLEQLRAQPLVVQSADQQWSLDRSMLMEMANAGEAVTLKPSALAIEQQLNTIATTLAVAPQPSRLEWNGDRVSFFAPSQMGRELDIVGAQQVVISALLNRASHVDLPVRAVPPLPGEAEQLGLIEELGRGESQFLTYSSPDRDANVQVGGNDINGVVLAPGEVFSFNQNVGAITWEKGYRWGDMIEAGVLVPALGGGICQVSTTVFRAAFWSGLEIVERHHHSWRLPWYEVDAPPGMDAAIALGVLDLRFRNNTQHHILVTVQTDLVQKRQIVIVYGTRDGRKVEMQALGPSNIGVKRHVSYGITPLIDETILSYYSQ